jgi:hypothetical protein
MVTMDQTIERLKEHFKRNQLDPQLEQWTVEYYNKAHNIADLHNKILMKNKDIQKYFSCGYGSHNPEVLLIYNNYNIPKQIDYIRVICEKIKYNYYDLYITPIEKTKILTPKQHEYIVNEEIKILKPKKIFLFSKEELQLQHDNITTIDMNNYYNMLLLTDTAKTPEEIKDLNNSKLIFWNQFKDIQNYKINI